MVAPAFGMHSHHPAVNSTSVRRHLSNHSMVDRDRPYPCLPCTLPYAGNKHSHLVGHHALRCVVCILSFDLAPEKSTGKINRRPQHCAGANPDVLPSRRVQSCSFVPLDVRILLRPHTLPPHRLRSRCPVGVDWLGTVQWAPFPSGEVYQAAEHTCKTIPSHPPKHTL